MALDLQAITALRDAIRSVTRTSTETERSLATCVRVDKDGTRWVRVLGSDTDTPVNGTQLSEMAEGDMVEVSFDNGSLSVYGNVSSPSVGRVEVDESERRTEARIATVRAELVEADQVQAKEIRADKARIVELEADTADIDTIRANSAKVQNLTAQQLEADHATIGTLDTTYMHANMSNADVAWINNGTIKDGAIVSAMINDVSANKLTAGTINGSVINVTNLNADNITTGTINGQRIGAGSLSLDKLSEDVYTEAEVNTIVDGLNDRIDGAIETFTGTAVPTLNNAPASSWNTTKLRDEHVGDVYYVVNSQSQQNGYCYRFTKSGSTYSWQLIKDSDVTAALSRLTTAEGKITSIESFDSTVSSFMTNTDSELTSVKSRATSLETRMTDAEGDISEKVDTSTFNSLSQTVDGNSASITSMSTVLTNNGLTSSTNITNTVNTVSQTATGNSAKITQLTTTLGTNADGTTKAGDVMHRTSAVEQDVSSFKTTVSETYATQTALATTNDNVAAAQTAADNAATAASNAQTTANTANNKQVAFSATSSTGATTAAKVAACTNFPELYAGATVTVRFSTANTSTGAITLNVNSTGAKTVYVNGAATSSSNQLLWATNANVTFTYDGSYWRVDSEPRTWYGTGGVAAATAAKTATINEVVICKGTTVVLNMTYENTSTSATLNVTSTGAKNIYYGTTTTRPTTSNGYGWGAGSTVSLTFDGQYWRIGDTTALARLTVAESTISSHTTSISQNATNIALRATKTEAEAYGRLTATLLEGDVATATDAAKTPVAGLALYGRSTQDGTPTPSAPVPIVSVEGNLAKPYSINATSSGISYAYDGTGKVTINGTATAWSAVTIASVINADGLFMLPAGDYTVVFEVENAASGGVRAQVLRPNGVDVMATSYVNGNGTASAAFSLTESTEVITRVNVSNGSTVNGTARIAIYAGSTAYPYVPYGNVGLWARGKNLWSLGQEYSRTSAGDLFARSAMHVPAGQYTLSFDVVSFTSGSNNNVQLLMYDQSVTVVTQPSVALRTGRVSLAVNPSRDVESLKLYVGTACTLANFQLERGSTATAYEPYASTVTPIDLDGHELRSLPDGTRDEVTVDERGHAVLVQRVGAFTFDGSIAPTGATAASAYFNISSLGILPPVLTKRGSMGYCNRYEVNPNFIASAPVDNRVVINASAFSATPRIVFYDSTHVGSFATWLASNPATVLYPLATPVTHDLGTIDPVPLVGPDLTAQAIPTAPFTLTYWKENAQLAINRSYEMQAELKVQADRIGMVVSNADASSSLALTADAMEYIGDHVEIKGTDGTSTVISGGRIQANSLTIGAFDSSTQDDILNSNVQVGGRNLLQGTTKTFPKNGTLNTYFAEYTVSNNSLPVAYTLEEGVTYTFSVDVESSVEPFQVSIGAGTNGYSRDVVQKNGLSNGRVSITFTPTATQLSSGTTFAFRAPRYATATNFTYAVDHPKLERGNKATDWTPAPEDITAEKYITAIDDNGIRVHAKSNATTNYAAINADGMNVVKGGVSVASYGDTARIGKEASTHVTISASETSGTGYTDSTSDMTLYDATGDSPDLRLYNTSRVWSDDSDGSEEVGIALGRDVYASKIRASIYEGEDPSSNLEILTGDLSTSVNAGTFIGSQRHWASDSSKFDKASVQTTSGAGGGASVQISAMSGNPNAAGAYAGMSVKATSGSTTVTIEADEIKLYDHQQDSYSPAYMTHGVVNSGQSTATPANGYKDFTVTFGHTYTSPPHVVPGFYSTSTAAGLGGLSCAVNSITTTGCTIRVFNNTSSARSPAVEWIAIG